MRSRAGMSGERAKRSFWPHPGQVTVNDEAVAVGWLMMETAAQAVLLQDQVRIDSTFYPKCACPAWAASVRMTPAPIGGIPTKELERDADDAEDMAFSLDPVDFLAARLLLSGGSPARCRRRVDHPGAAARGRGRSLRPPDPPRCHGHRRHRRAAHGAGGRGHPEEPHRRHRA